MRLVAWKTVRSREGRPDEFHFSFGKESEIELRVFFLFSLDEKEARKLLGDGIDKITGICVVHPVTFTLTVKENEG